MQVNGNPGSGVDPLRGAVATSPRSRVPAAVAAVAAGVALGVLGPLLVGPGGSPGHLAHVAHLTLSAGWAWAALAFGVGFVRASKAESAALATASLGVAVLAYYLTKAAQGEFRVVDLHHPLGDAASFSPASFLANVLPWVVGACLLGPLLGLAGNLARLRGFGGLPFRLVIPVLVLVETTERLRVETPLQDGVVGATWSITRLLAVVVIVGLVAHAVLAGRTRKSSGRPPAPRPLPTVSPGARSTDR
ncbi:hypothetical protein GCM10027160_33900 [Streptomyces calidiresistens]|uniref:hypothetical protein n=1 Tax=Streptomyces calidiresistens TaxID=1485586 RepID=UPI0015F81674|nr:hypothetical protein [Streptomyces calidiresistens]